MKLKQFLNENKLIDEIGKFTIITKPTGESTLTDILFDTDIFGLILQFKSGLEKKDIIGIYKNKIKAYKIAEKLLETQ